MLILIKQLTGDDHKKSKDKNANYTAFFIHE
jgi:hypothetical protein